MWHVLAAHFGLEGPAQASDQFVESKPRHRCFLSKAQKRARVSTLVLKGIQRKGKPVLVY